VNVTRTLLVLVTAAASLLAAAAVGQAQPASDKQPVVQTFYKGRAVRSYDYGEIRLKPGNRTSTIYAFANGATGQRSVVDVAPGAKAYSALWKVSRVTWAAGAAKRVLRTAAAVRAAAGRGDVTIRATSTVVNRSLLGFGQKLVTGFSAGRTIHYYDLGPVNVAPGNAVVPLFAVTNGVAGQHNVTGDTVAPGQTAYPPLWSIQNVTWKAGVTPRLLTSYAAIRSAAAAGRVTIAPTSLVVNCPVV
jgi:hypothetical protein